MKKEYEIYVFNLQRSLLRVSCVSICQISTVDSLFPTFDSAKV